MRTHQTKHALVLSAYAVFAAVIFWAGVSTPSHNWDMLAYVAAALSLRSDDAEAVHATVFANLKDHVGTARYEELTHSDDQYRDMMAADADLFTKQLPFYKPRILYSAAVLAISELGVNIFSATHVVSAIFASASVLLLLLLAKSSMSPIYMLCVLVFALLFRLPGLAGASSPDAMATFFVLLTMLAALRGSNWILFLLPLSVLVRPDLAIWSCLMGACLLWTKQFAFKSVLLGTVLTVGAYVCTNLWAHNYGWQTLFYFTFIEFVGDPSLAQALTATQYCRVLLRGTREALGNSEFLIFLIMLLPTSRYLRSLRTGALHRELAERVGAIFVLLPATYVLTHFLLFPAMWTRFFVAQYLIASIAFLWTLSNLERRDRMADSPALIKSTIPEPGGRSARFRNS